ncbi:hypothetical protein E4U38_004701 [Claviceps purpurea]|nr:hypothetical protein E4U38_004701 [Claviceps purpurea]
MKFSTILGTFAMSSLEAYRAYASPLDSSPAVLSLEERGQTEYCCMQVASYKNLFLTREGHSKLPDMAVVQSPSLKKACQAKAFVLCGG